MNGMAILRSEIVGSINNNDRPFWPHTANELEFLPCVVPITYISRFLPMLRVNVLAQANIMVFGRSFDR